jgi:hypothetical protein
MSARSVYGIREEKMRGRDRAGMPIPEGRRVGCGWAWRDENKQTVPSPREAWDRSMRSEVWRQVYICGSLGVG